MTNEEVFKATQNSINADAIDYAFARIFGVKAIVEYAERRIENRLVVVDRRKAQVRHVGATAYLIDERLRKNEKCHG